MYGGGRGKDSGEAVPWHSEQNVECTLGVPLHRPAIHRKFKTAISATPATQQTPYFNHRNYDCIQVELIIENSTFSKELSVQVILMTNLT